MFNIGRYALRAKYAYKYKSLMNLSLSQQFSIQFKSRDLHLEDIRNNPDFDIIIIGGGCNGVGVLMEAAFRGYRVLLIEKDDFGSGTSSKSTKLFHGGVRYLEQAFELSFAPLSARLQKFNLVKQAIIERGTALKNASYLSKKIPFVIPCSNIFQTLYYYLGSHFYYLIYHKHAPKNTKKFSVPKIILKSQLNRIFPYISPKFNYGVVYEDGAFNDSKLLIMTLLTSSEFRRYNFLPENITKDGKQANFLNYAQLKQFNKDQSGIIRGLSFYDSINKKMCNVKCRYVINCTGPWADTIRQLDNHLVTNMIIKVGGSHLTYDSKITNPEYGLCMASSDGRVTLVVPWQNRVIVGTTESVYSEATNNPTVSAAEKDFIRNAIEGAMSKLKTEQIRKLQISQWCGLRPLVIDENSKDTKSISRDFVIKKQVKSGLYSLLGGKWTIYRKMGESMMEKIVEEDLSRNINKASSSKTLEVQIIGSTSENEKNDFISKHGVLGKQLYDSYGSLAREIIKGDLKPLHSEVSVTRAQIQWIVRNQMVNTIEDILFRRTRIGFIYRSEITKQVVKEIGSIFGKVKGLTNERIKSLEQECIANLENYQFQV